MKEALSWRSLRLASDMLTVRVDVLLVVGLKEWLQLCLGWWFAEEWFECEWLCCGRGEKVWRGEEGGFVYVEHVTRAGTHDVVCRHCSFKEGSWLLY